MRCWLAAARKELPGTRIQSCGGARPAGAHLAQRDFTVNAIAFELPLSAVAPQRSVQQRLLDLHGGQAHLARRQLAF